MKKNYHIWHQLKTVINNSRPRIFFYDREIWFVNLGSNIGFEQDGKADKYLRPVVVLKKFNQQVMWVIPLTTTHKIGRHYYQFYFNTDVFSVAILSQLRLIDAKRLKYKIGTISKNDFSEIKQKLKQLLE